MKRWPLKTAMRFEQWRIIRPVLRHWRSLGVALILLTSASLLNLALPLVIRWLVDSIMLTGSLAQLNRVALGLLGIFLLQSLLSIGHHYLLARVGQQLIADLRLQLYAHVQRLPLPFFAAHRTGELVSRFSSDITVVQEAITGIPVTLLQQSVMLVGGITLMVIMNWRLTLLILLLIPPLVLIASLFGRWLQRISTTVQDRLADATVTLEEMLSGIRIVKSFVRESHEYARFARQVTETYTTAMQRVRVRAFFGPTVSLVGFSAVIVLLWYGGQQVVQGTLTPGQLVAFLFYMIMVASPMGDFARLYGELREAMGAGQRLTDLLDTPTEVRVTVANPVTTPLAGSVRFVGVCFSYNQAARPDALAAQTAPAILNGIDLDVAPGQTIALVGPSGAGKTTLINLIPRFYDPTAGQLLFDGYDARCFDLDMLRSYIGIVPQETFLFGGTIRENIAYGRLDADEEAFIAAARAANAHDFIMALPDGYDTIVGEKGIRLSSGQRQRIAIARVLLKDPRILILDEATSALDNESERLVQEALERLMVGRTTFVIAHRLSTIQRADCILVLQHGQIIERGNHQELLAQDGLYRRLWMLQFTDEALTAGW